MNEQEKRKEILEAEEAIRRLAAEMARASGIANSAEEVRKKLEEASAAVLKAKHALEEAAEQLTKSAEIAGAVIRKVSEEASKAVLDSSKKFDNTGAVLTIETSKIHSLVRWALVIAGLGMVGSWAAVIIGLTK